jgi:hypothetical protein
MAQELVLGNKFLLYSDLLKLISNISNYTYNKKVIETLI